MKREPLIKRLPIILIFGAWLLTASIAFARAGGGNNWGGGGGGGGGSSRSSGSSSWGSGSSSSRELSKEELVFYGIVCVIAIFVALIIERQTKRENEDFDQLEAEEEAWRGERRSNTLRSPELRNMLARDPGFDLQIMYRRVTSAFVRIQKAWSNERLDPVRALLSDGVHERFSIALKLNRNQGITNRFWNVHVHSVLLVDFKPRRHFEVATFAISASGNDTDIDIRSGKNRRSGNTMFTEYWTFVRKAGAQTPKGKGLLEMCCPACSAPAKPNDVNRCGSCGMISLAGHHDWILSEITQEHAPHGQESSDASLAALEIRDPAFNLQALEDLASAMFWRIRAAINLKDISLLKTMMPALPEITGKAVRDIGVGAVVFRGHKRVDEQGRFADRIRIDVAWQADGQRRFLTALYFQRSGTARTPANQGMKPLSCHACEAPLSGQSEASCRYCGALVADAGKTWVLTRWKDGSPDPFVTAA